MNDTDREFLSKINRYAEEVLGDIDPQKTPISFQLEKLKPVMTELSKETGLSLEDVFIKYMDLASEAGIEAQEKLKDDLGPDVDIEIR
ncbi:MAG: hypothetical protein K6G22_15405 [Lachnospiraceae bacterium]|nr:hypothetical protein [Lachnospiraceae bacterium]